MFFIFGIGPTHDADLFKETVEKNNIHHKTAEKLGQKYFKHVIENDEIVPHHRPFI